MHQPLKSLGRHLCVSTVLSLAVMMIVFPQLYVHGNYSFIRFQDTEFLYSGFFTFIQNVHLGRIQLWNNYDQMPFAFFYLVGMMTYTHGISAIIFNVASMFSADTGRFLYENTVFVFNVIPMIVRAGGLYLLLGLLIDRKWVILLTSVLAGSFFNPQFHFGLNCTALFSMLPLVMFFLLRFFTGFEMRDLLAAFLLVAVGVAVDPLVGLGYFYQGIHFFVLSSIIWVAVANRQALQAAWQRAKSSRSRLASYGGPLLTVLLTLLIVLPWVYLLRSTYGDYELAHETSRFANVFDLLGYFDRAHYGADPWTLIRKALEYISNEWVFQWVFLGISCVFFSICGAVLSRDSRKDIFMLTILFFWLLQFPREVDSFSSAAHWLNALTNPFNSVVRTAQMTGAFLLPTMMAPLFAMGVDRIWGSLTTGTPMDRWRLVTVIAAMVFVVVAALWPWLPDVSTLPIQLPDVSTVPRRFVAYVVLGAAAFSGMVVAILFRKRFSRPGAALTLGLLVLTDIGAARIYFSKMAQEMEVVTHSVDGISPDLNPVGLDYQNPLIVPLREHFVQGALGQVKFFAASDPVFMQGNFFRYTYLEKFFRPATQYKPRHIAYGPFSRNPDLRNYLKRNSDITFVADYAVQSKNTTLRSISSNNLDRRVVLVDAERGERILEQPPPHLKGEGAVRKSAAVWTFPLSSAEVGDDGSYVISLPATFPATLSSGVFTTDRENLSLEVGTYVLLPAQGWITRPLQYDLQNIRKGTLRFSMPSGIALDPATPITLRYSSSAPLNSLSAVIYEPDRMKFLFESEREGWLVLHQPFDLKWRLKINGSEARIYRTNLAFMATPIGKGAVLVELEYLPYSYLRFFLALSLVLSIAIMCAAFILGARRPMSPAAVNG